MPSRSTTSSSRTSSTSRRLTHSSQVTQTEYATRTVVLSRGPNVVEPASLPASPGSASSHSFSLRNGGNAAVTSAPSSTVRLGTTSSTSSARSPYDPTDLRANRLAPSHTSSSHSRTRSSSITSASTSSRQSDGGSSSTRGSLLRRNTASAFIEPIPEEPEPRVRPDETRNEHAIVPTTRGAPAARGTGTTGWRHTYHSQTGVLSVSASQTQRDTRGNTYVLNVVHNYPPPVISPPAVVPVVPVCCVPGNECEFHRRFRRF